MFRNALRQSGRTVAAASATGRIASVSLIPAQLVAHLVAHLVKFAAAIRELISMSSPMAASPIAMPFSSPPRVVVVVFGR